MSDSNIEDSPEVVFLSGDLMFASRVKAAAENAGYLCRTFGALGAEPRPNVRYVILDLASKYQLAATLVSECTQVCPDAKVIAYGPHVMTGKLAAARQAGIPVVLTRGQFDSKLSSLFDATN